MVLADFTKRDKFYSIKFGHIRNAKETGLWLQDCSTLQRKWLNFDNHSQNGRTDRKPFMKHLNYQKKKDENRSKPFPYGKKMIGKGFSECCRKTKPNGKFANLCGGRNEIPLKRLNLQIKTIVEHHYNKTKHMWKCFQRSNDVRQCWHKIGSWRWG